MNENDEFLDGAFMAVTFAKKTGHSLSVGACVYERLSRQGMEDPKAHGLSVFEFLEGEQLSGLDTLLLKYNRVTLYLSEEFENSLSGLGKKLHDLLLGKTNVFVKYVKKNSFSKKNLENIDKTLQDLIGNMSHAVSQAQQEKPLAMTCVNILLKMENLDDTENNGKFEFTIGSLDTYMIIDSAAAEAVNLLPKSDHPSQFGSIYGVLNRCTTKMGPKLLERWLRQPLLDDVEINKRLDIVELMNHSTHFRNKLVDGPLKGCPDVSTILAKMARKRGVGLTEVYKVYIFTKALPGILGVCEELVEETMHDENNPLYKQAQTFQKKIVEPLNNLTDKFEMYHKLVDHVIDLDELPSLMVNSKHDPELQELAKRRASIRKSANKIVIEANDNWASFTEVKLDSSQVHTFYLRSCSSDDERQLRSNNKNVKILSLQKNGVHFTTQELESLSNDMLDVDEQYEQQQQHLVDKAVETANTYMPVVEAACSLISELDVLTGFAIAAAQMDGYVRPEVLPKGQGIIDYEQGRHPCVELMDHVNFIPNDYKFIRDEKNFQLITGPNMGGKSTYIRSIGCITLMAQVGSFVPCSKAKLSVVDSILCRVGAGDAVQKGISTFMAEMLEAAVIIKTATADSLIIIDELGRGTSTSDGFGIAFGICKYIAKQLKSHCLFATHFHELTALPETEPNIVNKHVSASIEANDDIVMLYNVDDGPCNESYGIHIAKTANFPKRVLQDAKRKASELELGDAYWDTDDGKKRKVAIDETHKNIKAFDWTTMNTENVLECINKVVAPCPPFGEDS